MALDFRDGPILYRVSWLFHKMILAFVRDERKPMVFPICSTCLGYSNYIELYWTPKGSIFNRDYL